MSLFDLQDVCITIGSLTTLDLPMVVDLIGIYGLKGPYCTLTTTNWFLQALSVIPRGSWGDVARRFTMIRWANFRTETELNVLSIGRGFWEVRLPKSQQGSNRDFPLLRGKTVSAAPPLPKAVAAGHHHRRRRRRPPPSSPPPPPLAGICSCQLFEEFPSVLISSGLLVQADEGTLLPIVDLIRRNLPPPTVKSQSPCDSGWSQAPVSSKIAVDYRQSGPRPDPRLLRQAALEALTRSARTDSPRKTRPERFPAKLAAAARREA
ncbi:hypothetical protein F511_32703 [Dorcoceras hygrometricum]|uniref:Acyl-CoA dehydrogenase-related protein n=1 Tax=Dorcoceras hygrometricum TaxID=472368 RepID=A0A2Z7C5K8_9LAMI|nr:hypothetical protein F511_32703 [Dorcoceras hygrometricum]